MGEHKEVRRGEAVLRQPDEPSDRADDLERPGETFKREGPEPPTESTGDSIEDMNEIAGRALRHNIRPDEPA